MNGGPARSAPFVGRTEELVALRDAFDAASDGLVVTLIGGDPGVGKTALAEVLSQQLRAEAVPVHWGSCVELGGAPAFWPWIQILRGIGDGAAAEAQQGLAARATEPFAAYDAVHEVLRRRADRTRVLIFDDLHRADLPSLEMLRFLVSTASDLPVLVVGTHRIHELRTDPARDVVLAAIGRGGRRLSPGSLDVDEIQSLLADDLSPDVAAEVLARSGGNALYVGQLVDAVGRDGPAALARIPDGIRAAVRARLEPLPASTRHLLALASVLAPGFDPEVLAEVAGADPATIGQDLAPALAAGLLAPSGEGLAFTHALVRDTLDDELDAHQRATAHHAAATALADRPVDVAPAVVAQHLIDAGSLPEPAEVARWSDDAAVAARRLGGHREAARWAAEAARQWGRAGDPEQQGNRLVDAINDWVTVGNGSGAVTIADELAALARETGSAGLLAAAALARADVFEASQDVHGPPLLREALAHPDLGEGPVRADLLAGLVCLLGIPSIDGVRRDHAAALEALAELEALASAGDRHVLGRLAEARLSVSSGPLHHADRLRWLADFRALGIANRHVPGRLGELYWTTSLAFEAGDLHEVDRLLREWELLAERSDSAFWRWRGAMARASLLLAQGRLEAAEAHATAAGELVASLNPEMAMRVTTGIVLAARRDQGRLQEVDGLGRVNLGMLTVLAAADRGDVAVARRLQEAVVAAAEATGPDDLYWLCLLSLLAHTAAALDDVERCEWVADQLDPFVEQCVMWGRSYVFGGPVSESIGVARRGAGQRTKAAAAFRQAAAWADRAGAVGFGAKARIGLASVLEADDPDRVRLAAEGRATAVRLGLARVVLEADALVASSDGGAPGDEALVAPTADGAAPSPTVTSDGLRARVRTLGRFEVVGAGATEPARWSSRKARDALKVLICRRGRAIPREELIDLLWPDVDLAVGRSRLSVVLSMLRTALDPEKRLAVDPLRADRQSVALDLDVVAVDVEELLQVARDGLREGSLGAPDPTALVMAVALAEEGTFLGEDPYADFARPLRAAVERTRRDVLRALAHLCEGSGDRSGAARWWSRLLEIDPDDRSAQRTLIALLEAEGRHGEAAALRADQDRTRRTGP